MKTRGTRHFRKPPHACVFVGFAFAHLKYWNILNCTVVKFNQTNLEFQQQEQQKIIKKVWPWMNLCERFGIDRTQLKTQHVQK